MSMAGPRHRTTRRLGAIGALVGVGLSLILIGAPASAHGGDGELRDIGLVRQGDATGVEVSVVLVYVADGHGIPDATVTATVDGGTPVTLTPAGEGTYTGTIDNAPPGATVRITSVEPPVTAEGMAPPVDGPASTTAPPGSTEAPTTKPRPDPPTTDAATSTTEAGASTVTDKDDGGGGSTGMIVVLGGAIAIVGALGVITALKLTGRAPDDERRAAID